MSRYRDDLIIPRVCGKNVLDIGSVGQSGEYCLWDVLSENAESLVGVDLPNAVDTAKSRFAISERATNHATDERIIYGNMENIELGSRFEVIIAGDVIEHVSNQGLFLDNIYRHLSDDGRLIITTPSAKWPTVLLKPNPTHTLWHDIYTLKSLLGRHNFEIDYYQYYYGNKPHYSFWKIPLVYSQSIFVVAKKLLND